MKTKISRSITAAVATLFAGPVFALEAPADDAPPPPVTSRNDKVLPQIKLRNPQAKASVEAAFLGVTPGAVTEILAEHLGLQPGEGTVVKTSSSIVRSSVPERTILVTFKSLITCMKLTQRC